MIVQLAKFFSVLRPCSGDAKGLLSARISSQTFGDTQ